LYGDPEKIIKDYEDAEGFSEEQAKKKLLKILNK